jgi:hypothetical protein
MMFVPNNVKWFIAVQVEEFQVEGEAENLVYLNNILVKANSPETAYTRALDLCKQSNHEYQNSDEKTVVCKFRGLNDLFPIHDELEDGAELSFTSLGNLSEEEVMRIVRTKDQLELFHPDMQEVPQ